MRYADRQPGIEAALRDLRDPDPRVRSQAAAVLGRAPEEAAPRARAALRELLQDEQGELRYTAALSLGELRDVEALDLLIEQLEGDGNALARQAAVIALGLIGDPRATAPLQRALREGGPEVRFQATTSLAQVDPQAALPPLKRALRDNDPEVRASAAAALAELEEPAAAKALTAALEDTDPRVQLEAALALARLGEVSGSPVLVRALQDKERRHQAAEHLYRCPDSAQAPILERFLQRWLTPPLVKVWLAGALARLGREVGRRRLLDFLRSRRLTVRGLTIQLLGELGQPWARRALEQLAEELQDERWREEIAEALAAGEAQGNGDDASSGG